MGGVEKLCAATGQARGRAANLDVRDGIRRGERREKREKREEASDDSTRINYLSTLVRVEDNRVRCSTGCYRLAVLLHYKSYTGPVLPV